MDVEGWWTSLENEKLYELLVVLYNSCPFNITFEKDKNRFKLISNGEKELEFKNLSNQYGYKSLFHGSNVSNWHNIIRMGLKNYSGTSKQVNGAAFGKGIYLSKND